VPKPGFLVAIPDAVLELLFRNNMLAAGGALSRSEQAFRAFKLTFCDVNTAAKRMRWAPDREDTIEVLVPPAQLEGYPLLWEIALGTDNAEVARQASTLLHLIAQGASPSLLQEVGLRALRSVFLDSAMDNLGSAAT
jgi:hypothetical protein